MGKRDVRCIVYRLVIVSIHGTRARQGFEELFDTWYRNRWVRLTKLALSNGEDTWHSKGVVLDIRVAVDKNISDIEAGAISKTADVEAIGTTLDYSS